MTNDTIVAIATAAGRAGVGIIRISGPQTSEVCLALLKKTPMPRHATRSHFYNDNHQVLDQGIALYFLAPHSYTGEDVLELQAHGGPVLLDMLLQSVLNIQGTRLAKPGEFSERAFLNGKIDLTQAEAIADIIDAASEQAVRSAARSLQGEFSRLIDLWRKQLIHLRASIESAIDFPEEEIDVLDQPEIEQGLSQLTDALQGILSQAKQGSVLRDGIKVVIIGCPNVGKSSLLNALAGENLAIVNPRPGTTRDVLRQHIIVHGMPVFIVDTAGIHDAQDEIELEGITRAREQIRQADRILYVIDCVQGLMPADIQLLASLPDEIELSFVLNKCDATSQQPLALEFNNKSAIRLSAKTGQGIDLLRRHLAASMGLSVSDSESVFMARRRHVQALQLALQATLDGMAALREYRAAELLADDLRLAQKYLDEITGEFTSDDLLGEIFSHFCIGK